MTHNFEKLRQVVVGASLSNRWAQAVQEWQVIGVEEDAGASGICVCGKTGLRYLFEIYNRRTDQPLLPIGSSCVNMFEVEELDLSVAELRRLFDLRSAYSSHRRVYLTSEFFSRATLADLWQNGAFPPNNYNNHNGENDYRFLLNMFNQRHELTDKEKSKVWVLLNRTIKDFVMDDERLG